MLGGGLGVKLLLNIVIAAVAYFLGNISPAILIGKIHGIDIRKEGSGNAGTTNVIRTLGLKSGLATLAVDVAKGIVAAEIGKAIEPGFGIFVAFIFVILGHCFPALYDFKGGKGVATTLGAALALSWQSALLALAIAAIILIVVRIMSVASMIAVAAYPFILYWILGAECVNREIYTGLTAVIAVFVIVMHRENIGRLIRGEEKKLSFGKKKEN